MFQNNCLNFRCLWNNQWALLVIKISIDIEVHVGLHVHYSVSSPCSRTLIVIHHPVCFSVVMAHIYGI